MPFNTLFTTALTAAFLVKQSIAGYALQDDYSTSNFFSEFEFFTSSDPTHGFVNYVDQATAQSGGLISSSGSTVMMGVDSTNVAPNGRNSVRLTSNKVYNHGLIVLDVQHMPEGCGTWPAFWMTGPNWPSEGEIDIIEGVNDQVNNAMTLHTGPSCSIEPSGLFSGTIGTSNCDVTDPNQPTNAGCSIAAPASITNTYGSGLNAANGGVYVTEWTSQAISTWFFPRSSIPSDVTSGTPNPSTWGKPMAQFAGGCDIDNSIKNQQIVFDTTFCGDWAGAVWGTSSTCAAKASTCEDYVANNPSAFQDAYWEINSLKVYQENGASADSTPPAVSTASAGPTGIASGIPAVVSSVAPIPEVTPTTFAKSIVPLNQVTGITGFNGGAFGVAASSTPAAAVVTTPAPAAVTPASGQVTVIWDGPQGPTAAAAATPTPTTAPITSDQSLSTVNTSSDSDDSDDEPYHAGDPVPQSWIEGEGMPADEWSKLKSRKREAEANAAVVVAAAPPPPSSDGLSNASSPMRIVEAVDTERLKEKMRRHVRLHRRGLAHGHVHKRF